MAQQFELKLDQGALNILLKSPNGVVGRVVQRVGHHVLMEALSNVPVEKVRFGRDHPAGYLKSQTRILLWPGPMMSMEVGSATSYATDVHQGTRPHKITAHSGKLLNFPGKGGKIVAVKSVNHPGTKPNPYLWKALQTAMRPYR